ncbi:MAG: helix-turn-helix domain-containing protein [Synergistaceae bacterium]|nr:helix-turn-helix domain-containing protein [Synergistaceae bacterium]
MDRIGINIRKERVKARYNQKMLAEALEIGQAAISRYENGSRRPSINMIKKIAAVLKCSFTTLVYEENEFSGNISKTTNYLDNLDDSEEIFIETLFTHSPEMSEQLSSLSKRCAEMTSDHWQFLTNHLMFAFGLIEAQLDRKKL